MRTKLFIIAMFGTAAACSTADQVQDPTFENIVHQVFEPRCTLSGSCHTAPTVAARLDLTLEHACDTLINVPSCLFPDRMRVLPGHPEDSFFFHKLTGQGLNETPTGSCGTQTNLAMPFGAAALSDSDLSLIHTWIEAGAQCTPSGPPPPMKVGPAIESFTLSQPVPVAGETFTVTMNLDQLAPKGGQMLTLDMDQNVISAPVQLVVPENEKTVHFDALPMRPTSRFAIRVHSGPNTKEIVLRIGGLEIAEVLADPIGPDDQLTWVKVHNTSSLPIDLNTYRIKAGQGDYDLVNFGLSGTLPPGACAVVGGPVQSAANAEPIFWQAAPFSPNLPKGGAQPAGFAIFDGNAPINNVVTPVDTMLVGTGSAPKLLGPDAEIATPFCATPAEGQSALRNGARSCTAAAMQPRTCP